MDTGSRNFDTYGEHETSTLIGSDKVEGTAVYNRAGDKLGMVKRVMINKRSGQAQYAEMAFGGFLGMGEDVHPVPWDLLDYDVDQGGYVVDLDKDQLKDAPTRAVNAEQPPYDQAYDRQIRTYYGTVMPVV